MTNQSKKLSCIDCAAKACKTGESEKYPEFCLTKNMEPELLQGALDCYDEEENRRIMVNAANVESEFYGKMTRVEELWNLPNELRKKNWNCHLYGVIRRSKNIYKDSA